jgi:hypothetical protein
MKAFSESGLGSRCREPVPSRSGVRGNHNVQTLLFVFGADRPKATPGHETVSSRRQHSEVDNGNPVHGPALWDVPPCATYRLPRGPPRDIGRGEGFIYACHCNPGTVESREPVGSVPEIILGSQRIGAETQLPVARSTRSHCCRHED